MKFFTRASPLSGFDTMQRTGQIQNEPPAPEIAEAARWNPSSAARLDRLPITAFHRQMMWLLGIIFFFELGDINTFSFAAPAIRIDWNLSIQTIGVITSATFFGMFVGATTGGWFSDRLGRKKALILSTAWYSGFSFLNAFAWNPAGLFLTRLLTGVGLSAMTVVGITYICELFPARQRGAYQGWIMMIGLTGIPVTAYVARFFIPLVAWGWRLVFLWGALGMVFLLFSRHLEESPRWFERHGRFSEAEAALKRIEKRVQEEAGSLPAVADSFSSAGSSTKPAMPAAPSYFSRTVLLVVAWSATSLGFYGFVAWVPTLLVAHGVSLVNSLAWSSAMSIGAIPGAWIAALISDRWERKYCITAVALAIASCGMIYGMTFATLIIVVFGFLVNLFVQTFTPLLYSYTPECYPTEIRNSGAGIAYGVGRLANVVGPLLVAFLYAHYGYRSVFVYISTMWVLVAITVGGFGPLTKERSLG